MPAGGEPRTPTHNPGFGRPHDILRPIDIDGRRTTVLARIIELVRAGNYVETAARTTGTDRETLGQWLKRGGRLLRAAAVDPTLESTWDRHERAYVDLNHSVADAAAEWEATMLAIHDHAARGNRTRTITTTKVFADGTEEVTTRVEGGDINLAALQWRLERKFPDRFSRRTEVSGPGGAPIPIEVRQQAIIDALNAGDAQAGAHNGRADYDQEDDDDARPAEET